MKALEKLVGRMRNLLCEAVATRVSSVDILTTQADYFGDHL